MLRVNGSKGGGVTLHDKDSIDEGYPAAALRLPARLDGLARRIFDLLATTMCLILLAPILLLTSIAIKLDSRGPIFIREMRYGYKNRAIHISKFRVAMVCSHGEQINRRAQFVWLLPMSPNRARGASDTPSMRLVR
jgi:lipopolysaccharide/colanic/teichoic acid biosynthesis glycosyltransferase